MNKPKCRCSPNRCTSICKTNKSDGSKSSKVLNTKATVNDPNTPKLNPESPSQCDHNNNEPTHKTERRKKSSKDKFKYPTVGACGIKYDATPIVPTEGHGIQRLAERFENKDEEDAVDKLDFESANVGTTASFISHNISRKSVTFPLNLGTDNNANIISSSTTKHALTTSTSLCTRSLYEHIQELSSVVGTKQIVPSCPILKNTRNNPNNSCSSSGSGTPYPYSAMKVPILPQETADKDLIVATVDSIEYEKISILPEEVILPFQPPAEEHPAKVTEICVEELPEEIQKLPTEELEQLLEELGPTEDGATIKQLIDNRKNSKPSELEPVNPIEIISSCVGIQVSSECCCTWEIIKKCLDDHPEFLDKYVSENISKAKMESWLEDKINKMFGSKPADTEADNIELNKSEEFIGDSEDLLDVNENALCLSTTNQRMSFRIGPATWCDNLSMVSGEIPWHSEYNPASQSPEPPRLMSNEEVTNFMNKYGIDLNML